MENEIATLRILNETAVREHALYCSKTFRNGKFTRVSQDFLDEVRADVEAAIITLRNSNQTHMHAPAPILSDFTTGALCDKLRHEWNNLIGRIIQNKVQRQPSVGQTLSRTR